MARKTRTKTKSKPQNRLAQGIRRVRRTILRALLAIAGLGVVWVIAYSFLPVPTTPYMFAESRREGGVDYQWVSVDEVAPVMLRAVVAAEDANFCQHWGFDLDAIRSVIEAGGERGASTITQQVAKNAFLWHGRSWPRKALEALLTPAVEAVWSKRRILEVYLNIAEFDRGVFGVEAASRHYFGVGPEALSPTQAGRLAAVLPAPKDRDAAKAGAFVQRRGAQIVDGAATIARDGRASCFED